MAAATAATSAAMACPVPCFWLAAAEPAPPADVAPEPAPVVTDLDALLDQLERSSDDLRAFTAELVYHKWDPVTVKREIRTGRIIYQSQPAPAGNDAPPTRRFAIAFDRLFVGSRQLDMSTQFVFDGSWLTEIDHQQRKFIKRRIVAPGRVFDPLKLGEGPIPLPIGQPKREVLARFDAQLIDVPTEGQLVKLKDVRGLRLIPKPGTSEAKEFLRVDLFYDRQTHLPVGIETIGATQLDENDPTTREKKTILLKDVQRNPELTPGQLQALAAPEPDPEKWQIQIDEWRDEP